MFTFLTRAGVQLLDFKKYVVSVSERYPLTSKGHQITAAPSAIRQTSLKRLIGTHPTPA